MANSLLAARALLALSAAGAQVLLTRRTALLLRHVLLPHATGLCSSLRWSDPFCLPNSCEWPLHAAVGDSRCCLSAAGSRMMPGHHVRTGRSGHCC